MIFGDTPPKTNMEPENGGPLEVWRFLLETIISRFHVNFWGCIGFDLRPQHLTTLLWAMAIARAEAPKPSCTGASMSGLFIDLEEMPCNFSSDV